MSNDDFFITFIHIITVFMNIFKLQRTDNKVIRTKFRKSRKPIKTDPHFLRIDFKFWYRWDISLLNEIWRFAALNTQFFLNDNKNITNLKHYVFAFNSNYFIVSITEFVSILSHMLDICSINALTFASSFLAIIWKFKRLFNVKKHSGEKY